MKTIQLNNYRIEVEATKVTIITNDAEGAKTYNTADQAIVNAYLAGLIHTEFNSYPYRKEGIWMVDSPENIKKELLHNRPGYVNGEILQKWFDKGEVHRIREIKADGIYRLSWDGFHWKTRDVVYMDKVDGEYEGNNGPQHNRNTLRMLEGFERIVQLIDRKANVTLGFPTKKDEYMTNVLETLNLLADGKEAEARKHYNEGARKANARGGFARVVAKNKKEPVVLTGEETVLAFREGDTELTPTLYSELFGATIFLVEGGDNGVNGNVIPFIYTPTEVNAADVYGFIQMRKARVFVQAEAPAVE